MANTHEEKENVSVIFQNIFSRWGLSLNSDGEIILLGDNEPLPSEIFNDYYPSEATLVKAFIAMTVNALSAFEAVLEQEFITKFNYAGTAKECVLLEDGVLLEKISITLPMLPSSVKEHLMSKAAELTKQNFPAREKDVIDLLKKLTFWDGHKSNFHYVKAHFFNSLSLKEKSIGRVYLEELFSDFKVLDDDTVIFKMPGLFFQDPNRSILATIFGLLIKEQKDVIKIQNDSEETDEFFETLATLAVTNDFAFAYATAKDLVQVT